MCFKYNEQPTRIRYSLYLYQDSLRALKIKYFDLLRSCIIKLLIPALNLYNFHHTGLLFLTNCFTSYCTEYGAQISSRK